MVRITKLEKGIYMKEYKNGIIKYGHKGVKFRLSAILFDRDTYDEAKYDQLDDDLYHKWDTSIFPTYISFLAKYDQLDVA